MLRKIILAYSCLTAVQLFLAAALYSQKVGLDPAVILESYQGSEAMLRYFPNARDGFRPPRTAGSLLGHFMGHVLAFGLSGFLILHWLFSQFPRVRVALWPGAGFLIAGFLEAIYPILLRFGPPMLVFGRLPVFLAFLFTGLALTGQLLRLAWSAREDA